MAALGWSIVRFLAQFLGEVGILLVLALGCAAQVGPPLAATRSHPALQPSATEPILPFPPTATELRPSATSADLPGATAAAPTAVLVEAKVGQPPGESPPGRTSDPAIAQPTATMVAPATIPTVPSPQPSSTVPSPQPSSTVPPPSPEPSVSPRGLYTLRQRLGVCAAGVPTPSALADELGFGWYLDWGANSGGFDPVLVEYMPMIRLKDGQPSPNGQALLAAVEAMPGAVWLIGNEPDVKWQDNITPEAYAQAYHDLYLQLKTKDPTSQVAIGGVSQPTPLRLRYLERILEAYQAHYGEPMPVDVWNVHNFILREERDSWGVDIPPGMADQAGALREIADHDDLAIFQKQIVDLRRWMKARGQQNKPLIITEYGILMPTDYGFPPAQVERFMLDTFDFLRTKADPNLGYPADGGRLVQRWCWYSLADDRYPTGNLLDRESGALTPLGESFRRYALSLP